MWLGGLRGGIALVLSLEISSTWCDVRTKTAIISATFMVICTTLLVCGSTTEACLVMLGLVPPPSSEKGDGDAPPAHHEADKTSLAEQNESRLPNRIGRWVDQHLHEFLVGERK